MVDLFVEREFDPPLSREDVLAMVANSEGCFGIYKVGWVESFLSLDGRKMLCHFLSPDTESLRMAFRQTTGNVPPGIWTGSVHTSPGVSAANVVVERNFIAPVLLDELHALEVKNSWCLETRNVKHHRTMYASDQKRTYCFYQAPDAEAVREAQTQAGMPMVNVWSFQHIHP